MITETPTLSETFRQLYCDPSVFEGFSSLHPVSFNRVLPFQADDRVFDHPHVLAAETAYLSRPDTANRQAVVESYGQVGLLTAEEATNLKLAIDFFDADFFELVGEIYAKAGSFICALRWYREFIVDLETHRPGGASDFDSVYGSVGYCLYSLGLYPEAITWSRSCLGPRQIADTVSRVLINYEAQLQLGCVRSVERAAGRTRYTVSAFDPIQANQLSPRLLLAMKTFAPFEEFLLEWVNSETPPPSILPGGYPFQVEVDPGALPQHRLNLLFSICAQAETLANDGHVAEAKRLLREATILEPKAGFIKERLALLP